MLVYRIRPVSMVSVFPWRYDNYTPLFGKGGCFFATNRDIGVGDCRHAAWASPGILKIYHNLAYKKWWVLTEDLDLVS